MDLWILLVRLCLFCVWTLFRTSIVPTDNYPIKTVIVLSYVERNHPISCITNVSGNFLCIVFLFMFCSVCNLVTPPLSVWNDPLMHPFIMFFFLILTLSVGEVMVISPFWMPLPNLHFFVIPHSFCTPQLYYCDIINGSSLTKKRS